MQIDAALYNHQSKARSRTVSDIMSAMEGVEKPFSVGFRDADSLVVDAANHLRSDTPDFETHQPANVRILDRVS